MADNKTGSVPADQAPAEAAKPATAAADSSITTAATATRPVFAKGGKLAADPGPVPQPAAPPSFWIADRDLYLGGEGAMPVRAFAAGDRVPHEHVIKFGWQDRCHIPDPWASAPPTPAPSSEE